MSNRILTAYLLATVASAAGAQNTMPTVPGHWRRITITRDLTWAKGGPGDGLVTQLQAAGYNYESPAWCLIFCAPAVAHPNEQHPSAMASTSIRFAVTHKFAVGLTLSQENLGGAIGYRSDSSLFGGTYINSDWETRATWAVAYWTPAPGIRLGGGPALHHLVNVPESRSLSRIGAIAEVGLELPEQSRFFLDLAARYHFIPATDVAHGLSGAVMLRPPWSHFSFLAGLGLRL